MAVCFFTVVCEKDHVLWRLQARSLSKFIESIAVEKIILVVNEGNKASALRVHNFASKNLQEYGSHSKKVILLDSSDFIDRPNSLSGWKTQQIIKLRAGRFIEAERIVFLDSKNHFVRTVSEEDFFEAGSGKPRICLRKRRKGDIQHEWITGSLKAVGLDESLADRLATQTTTPFPVLRQTLQDLELHLLSDHGTLEEFFEKDTGKASEFLLISAIILKKYGSHKKYFSPNFVGPATLFRKYPENEVTALELISEAQKGSRHTFSLHADRIEKLSSNEVEKISALWESTGLASHQEVRSILRLKD